MALWYPSIVVNLRIRFDEAFQIVEKVPVPQPLEGSVVPYTAVSQPVARPLFTQTGDGVLTHIVNRVPRSADIDIPSVTKAGRFSLKFDYRELPIDPRAISAVGVEIFQGAVSPEDFATGMIETRPDGRRVSILNVWNSQNEINEDLLLLAGTVDNWRMTHTEKSAILQLDGRDLRAILLDSPYDLRLTPKLNLKQPIHKLIEQIVMQHPFGSKITVRTNESEWSDGKIPFVFDKNGYTRVRSDSQGGGGNGQPPTGNLNFWEMIVNYASVVGGIPYFAGRTLFIRPARGLYKQLEDAPENDSFSPFSSPRQDSDGNALRVRRMVYGRNLQELTFERKYTGVKVPVVEISSHDLDSTERGPGKVRVAQWPTRAQLQKAYGTLSPSGEAAGVQKLKIWKPGIKSQERLQALAQDLYEEIGRQELGGSAKTKDLASFQGTNADPDLLRLRPADAVEFVVDINSLSSRNPLASELTDQTRQDFNERVDFLRKRLSGKAGSVDANLVRAMVATAQGRILDALKFFRIGNVKYNWVDGKVTVSFDFQNYITIRAGTPPSGPRKVSTEVSTTSERNDPPKQNAPTPLNGLFGPTVEEIASVIGNE